MGTGEARARGCVALAIASPSCLAEARAMQTTSQGKCHRCKRIGETVSTSVPSVACDHEGCFGDCGRTIDVQVCKDGCVSVERRPVPDCLE